MKIANHLMNKLREATKIFIPLIHSLCSKHYCFNIHLKKTLKFQHVYKIKVSYLSDYFYKLKTL